MTDMIMPHCFLNIKTDELDRKYFLWPGGNAKIYGARIFGGVFRGGVFRDGEFHGGVFWDGVFLDGEFLGGVFWGGEFNGGVFWDGVFRGGVFLDGVFCDGVFRGNKIEYVISYLQYKITVNLAISPPTAQIGCHHKTISEWIEMSLDYALKMGLNEANYEPIRDFLKKFNGVQNDIR